MGMITGCAFQYQVDDHESRISSIESKFIEPGVLKAKLAKIDELEKDLEELQNLKEIKDRKDILELQEQSESYRKAFLFLADEMDKHVVAIESLFKNDEAAKQILETALELFEKLDQRDKLIIEELDKK